MELARQMRLRRLGLRAKRLPCLENEEADASTSMDFKHFDPSERIWVDLNDMKFGILHDLVKFGEDYLAELEAANSSAKLAAEKEAQSERAHSRSKR